MSCKACEQAQASDGVAYYRLGNANLAVQGCRKHLAEAFDRLNLHDELVVALGNLLNATPDPATVYPSSPKELARRLLAKAQP